MQWTNIPFAYAGGPPNACPRLYDFLRGSPGQNPLLAFTSSEKKDRFLLDAFKNGDNSFDAADSFARHYKELSVKEQQAWHAAIGAMYRKVPKKPEGPLAPTRIGGRRLLDRILTLIDRNDEKLVEQLRDTPAHKALAHYIDKQATFFGSEYSGEDAIQVLKVLQDYLRSYRAQKTSGPSPHILVGGSFINGRARIQISDIDLSLSDPERARLDLPGLEKRINELLKPRYPESKLSLEAHSAPAGFYGTLNTVVIKLESDSAQLYVFPPAVHSWVGGGSFQPGAPQAYPLNLP